MRIYTIGYGNKGLQTLLDRLGVALEKVGAGHFLVFDVRARPSSWSLDLTYPRIAKLLQMAGHDYRWCRYLGNNGTREKVQLTNERLGLAELRVALGNLTAREELVLLCAERDPARCHRSLITKLAQEVFDQDLEVIHL